MAKRVLFVDDEDWSVDAYFPMLRDHGLEVDLAMDGDQAIDLLRENSYDLIVLDIMLPPGEQIGDKIEPRKAGEVLLRKLRRNEIARIQTSPKVPVMIVTAVTDHKLTETMKELQAQEVFQKPVLPLDLVPQRILALLQEQ